MVDGNIEIKLSLKQTAEEVAQKARTLDTVYYDETTKTYFIDGVNEEMLKEIGFKFLEYSFNKTPIYKKQNIYASVNSDPAFGRVMIYKTESSKLSFEEE